MRFDRVFRVQLHTQPCIFVPNILFHCTVWFSVNSIVENGNFHLSRHDNIFTITLINIHHLYIVAPGGFQYRGKQGWIQHDLVGGGGGCSGADCRVVSVMCATHPSTTVFEL